jgi:hypothetical protein
MLVRWESMLIHANPLLGPPVPFVPGLFPLKTNEIQWKSMLNNVISLGSMRKPMRNQGGIDVKSMWHRCETNAKSMRTSMRHQCDIEVRPMWNQCELAAKPMRLRCETDAKSIRNRCDIDLKSMWNQCEITMCQQKHPQPPYQPQAGLIGI